MKKWSKAWLAPIAAMLILLVLNLLYLSHWLDSDMAAEMMFSELLAKQGRLFATPDWYYSTEFRLLYTQLFMTPLFRIMGNWHMIRIITNMLTYLLLLFSYYYMMKKSRADRTPVILSGVLLLLPFSETMALHMQFGNTYMPHIILLFFYMGLFLEEKKDWKLLFYLLLALAMGLSGVRYFLAMQAPLLLTCLWILYKEKENRKENLPKLWKALFGLAASLVGYAINVLYISRNYQFQTYDTTTFIDVYQGVFLERLQDAFGALLMLFGYIPGKSVLSVRGVVTMIAFLLPLLLGICVKEAGKSKEKENHFFFCFFLSSLFVNLFVLVFTNSTLVPRYYLPTLAFVLPLLVVFFTEKEKGENRTILTIALLLCIVISTGKTVGSFALKDKNENRHQIVSFLTGNGYDFGYATYWNGNITTELSGGKVRVANIMKPEELQFFRWSSDRRYYEEDYAQGKVFVMLAEDEKASYEKTDLVKAGEKVYEDGSFTVYSYENNRIPWELIERK